MQELVIQSSTGNDVTTSLIVAEVFGKEHNKVCRDIENLSCSEQFRVANFGEATFENSKTGQLHKMYEMTKDGFSFLVMGYTGAKAGEFKERFIAEFNKREAMLRSDDYILMRSQQILQGRLELAEKNLRKVTAEKEQLRLTAETQEQQLKEQAPKVDYYDKVIDSTGLQTTNMIASCFGISPIKLNKLLCAWGVQYKQSGCYFLYAKYRDKGYAEHKPYAYVDSSGETKTRQHMFWTERGKQFLIDLYTLKAKEERAKRAFGKQEAGQVKKEEAAL